MAFFWGRFEIQTCQKITHTYTVSQQSDVSGQQANSNSLSRWRDEMQSARQGA
jgi:hypothetical protein